MPRLLAAIALAAAVAACGSIAAQATPRPTTPPASPSTAIPLVTVESRGGLCITGECRSVVTIEADGRLRQIVPNDVVLGRIPPELVAALRVEIEAANFPLIESRPFTGQCPTAYDGQETIYSFSVAGGAAFERISTCEVAIDANHPLFRAVERTLAAAR